VPTDITANASVATLAPSAQPQAPAKKAPTPHDTDCLLRDTLCGDSVVEDDWTHSVAWSNVFGKAGRHLQAFP
jgi:hypothetical protein